ncbi:MAG: SEC-C domain-containing protein [Spirochaetales bacterium]|nr:SEC-C domain-containing protein [Spirochaetales bacterium]
MIARGRSQSRKTRELTFGKTGSKLNEYGMTSSFSESDADFNAFLSVQLERYLKRKTVKRFCSDVERDVIVQIISDSWVEFLKNRELGQMDTDQKISSYYAFTLVFPYFVAEEESLISVDFRSNSVLKGEDLCSCGSGVPFRQCCGGIKSLGDLLNGSY